MNTPTFTPEPPTKPGDFRWRKTDSHRPILVEVVECPETGGMRAYSSEHEGDFVTHPFFGGLWCRLVPAQEVERAFMEAADAVSDKPLPLTIRYIWHTSRAKRVMEGEV